MGAGLAVGLGLFLSGLLVGVIGLAGTFSWIQLGVGVSMAIVGARMLVVASKSNG